MQTPAPTPTPRSQPTTESRGDRDIPPVLRTQRTLQVVLGLFWILDAALQFQPFMFGRGFVDSFILSNANGQPFVVGDLITHIGNFLAPDIAVWNTLFALIQLGIGVGLLFRRSVKPALAVSFVWVLGVWVFGEGMGMLLTGTASALTGAPGSVLIYGLLGLMAWPRAPRRYQPDWSDRPTGIATSAAAQGIGRSITPLAVWAGYWSLAAVLFVLPHNRTPTSVQSAIVGMAPRTAGLVRPLPHEPREPVLDVGHPDRVDPRHPRRHHRPGPARRTSTRRLPDRRRRLRLPPVDRRPGPRRQLVHRQRHRPQHQPGDHLVGCGNDADRDRLEGGMAFARRRGVAAVTGGRRPRRLRTRSRRSAVAASYPAATAESTSSAMAGMAMGGSAGERARGLAGRVRHVGDVPQPHQSGLRIAGLDLANSPEMAMGTSPQTVMNMNGADASAAAGFNTTKVDWHYTGPPLPNAEARTLLNEGNNAAPDIHMATSGCAARLTSSEDIEAQQYVQQTSAAVAQYAGPSRRWPLDTWRRRPRTTRSCTTSTRRSWRRTRRPGGRRPAARRRPDVRGDAVGAGGAGGCVLYPAGDRDVGADALRRARAVASAHAGLRARHRPGDDAARHHGVPAVRGGDGWCSRRRT